MRLSLRHIVPRNLLLKVSLNLWPWQLPHGMAVVALDPGGSISTPMLKSCAPQYINESPTPETWSHKAIEYILNITIDKNGDSLTCPACI